MFKCYGPVSAHESHYFTLYVHTAETELCSVLHLKYQCFTASVLSTSSLNTLTMLMFAMPFVATSMKDLFESDDASSLIHFKEINLNCKI